MFRKPTLARRATITTGLLEATDYKDPKDGNQAERKHSLCESDLIKAADETFEKAKNLQKIGEFKKANDQLEHARHTYEMYSTTSTPQLALIYYYLGINSLALGDEIQGRKHLEKVSNLTANQMILGYAELQLAETENNSNKEKERLDHAFKLFSYYPREVKESKTLTRVSYDYGKYYFKQRNYVKAKETLAPITKLVEGDKQLSMKIHRLLGKTLTFLHDYKAAIEHFQIAGNNDDTSPVSLLYLGICHFKLNNRALAGHYFESFLENEQTDLQDTLVAYLGLCLYYEDLKKKHNKKHLNILTDMLSSPDRTKEEMQIATEVIEFFAKNDNNPNHVNVYQYLRGIIMIQQQYSPLMSPKKSPLPSPNRWYPPL